MATAAGMPTLLSLSSLPHDTSSTRVLEHQKYYFVVA
jgi:hypothetical protein